VRLLPGQHSLPAAVAEPNSRAASRPPVRMSFGRGQLLNTFEMTLEPRHPRGLALRGETQSVEKMKARIDYDLDYLRNWSLPLDLYIIAKTAWIVLKGENAH
jgi:hypothetical protein